MIVRVGFDFSEDVEANIALHSAAAFALAEHLTGVRVTPELLASATFLCGAAAYPR